MSLVNDEPQDLRTLALIYEEQKRRERVCIDHAFQVPLALRLAVQNAERLLERAIMRTMHEDA